MTVCQWSRGSYHALESGFPTTSLTKHILEKLDHPNVIKLYDVVESKREIQMVMEFIGAKSLD